MKLAQHILFAAGLVMIISGCSEINPDAAHSNVQFRLTDSPGEYQQVNIDVVAVKMIVNDSLIELGTNQGIYNILEFVNGRDTLLVNEEITSGYVSQIRLILGENNTVMIDSTLFGLKTPSAQQSGLKLNVHNVLLGGESYAYIIDFRVEKSIVKTGNDQYILKPVIRIFTEALTGSIKGVVQPFEAEPLVMAIKEEDTVSTYANTVSGDFKIRGLAEGSYRVEFKPSEGFKDTILSDIGVIPGQVTELDTLLFN